MKKYQKSPERVTCPPYLIESVSIAIAVASAGDARLIIEMPY